MPNEPDEIRNAWQTQPAEGITMSLEEIRRRASRFQRHVWWRNAREYLAIAVVDVVFGVYVQRIPTQMARVGSVMTMVGALYVAYQIHRRASSRTAPAGGALDHCLGFHRRQLERQRDALKSVWVWYLAPLVPGLAVFIAGTAIVAPIPFRYRLLTTGIMFAVVAVVFWLVAKLNKIGARRLQAKIDELRELEQ